MVTFPTDSKTMDSFIFYTFLLVQGDPKFLRQIFSRAIIRNMGTAAQLLNSCCLWVCTYTTFQTGKDWRGEPGRTHRKSKAPNQPFPSPRREKTSAALGLFVFLFALSAPPAHPSPSQPGLPGAELSSHLRPIHECY